MTLNHFQRDDELFDANSSIRLIPMELWRTSLQLITESQVMITDNYNSPKLIIYLKNIPRYTHNDFKHDIFATNKTPWCTLCNWLPNPGSALEALGWGGTHPPPTEGTSDWLGTLASPFCWKASRVEKGSKNDAGIIYTHLYIYIHMIPLWIIKFHPFSRCLKLLNWAKNTYNKD